MKNIYTHIKHIFSLSIILLILGTNHVMAQTNCNPVGFEDNSVGDWVGGSGTESVAMTSANARTGSYALALTTTSVSTNRYWYSNSPYGASAVGTYVHFIYWAKATTASTVDASMQYKTTAPPIGVGTFNTGGTSSIGTTAWTRVYYNKGNVNSRYYYPSPRRTVSALTTIYFDDMIIYTSNSSVTDIADPSPATNIIALPAGLSWDNGTDAATGLQSTLIFKRTAGINGTNDLSLNDQAIYSLTPSEGPSIVGNWTLIDPAISTAATSYTPGTLTLGDEYAVVHRDLAYNYSSPTYAVVTSPTPLITIKELSLENTYNSGSTYNMGTVFTGPTVSRTFRLYNYGVGTLNISSSSLSTGAKYTLSSAPSATVAQGDSTDFTIEFTPGATNGEYADMLSILSDDTSNPTYTINLTGGKADFVLPYTYQSTITSPIFSNTELKHDYTALEDIPAEFTLGSGSAVDASHFYANYTVYQSEGNCLPNSSSALRIGQGTNSLKVSLPNCGTVTAKWCSTGYRKIKISNDAGSIYEQSPSYVPGFTCNTTTTVVNDPSPTTINIEFLANDTNLLTTLYYLEITPYNASTESSAKDILVFSSGIAGENVFITENVISVKVAVGTDITNVTPSIVTPSPYATVSPALGASHDFTNPATYTVTAQDGTTKTYTVTVEEQIDYGTAYYADSIIIPVDMLGEDKIIEVIEASNSNCQTPISGNGSNYTIYFLDLTDKPIEGYDIQGLSEICLGSIATYTIGNAPPSNSPQYVWHLTGASRDLFTIVGDTVGEFLRVKAPDIMTEVALDFSINVDFDPSNCEILKGQDTLTISLTEDPPHPITNLTADCSLNDLLVLSANGSADATTYNWSFTPNKQVVVQTGNDIVINLAGDYGDITARVNTQNGCGITENDTDFPIDYATEQSTWTGAVDNDWTNHSNWTRRVPKACTDVTIPDVGGGVLYPIIADSGECHYITFEPGGAVLGLKELDYVRAYVQVDLQRNKWYTLTAPLKEMYSGDYYFTGDPRSYMKLFDDVNPDKIGDTTAVGTWTQSFANLHVPLTPGMGYGFLVDSFSYNYPIGPIYDTSSKIVYFPRELSTDVLMTSASPISGVSGKPYPSMAESLPKDPNIAYRFAMEDGANQLQDAQVDIKQGLNLIGNPLMTHLDFNALYASNSTKITEKVKFWNGTTFTTYLAASNLASSLDMSYTSIPPMQSFFVDGIADGTTLDISLNSHFVSDEVTKLRKAKTAVKVPVLHAKSTINNLSSSIAIAYKDEASNAYGNEDAFKLFTQYKDVPEIYSVANGMALDINMFGSLPYLAPIGIKTNSRGSIQLDFAGANDFDDKIEVTLMNTLTGEQQNLKSDANYELDYDGNATDGYLFVEFRDASAVTGVKENQACTSARCIQVFAKDRNTISAITPENEHIKKMTVWEQDGKQLYHKAEINSSKHDAYLITHSNVCVVRVETVSRTMVVKVFME